MAVYEDVIPVGKLQKILVDPGFTCIGAGGNQDAAGTVRVCQLPGLAPVYKVITVGDHDTLTDIILLVVSQGKCEDKAVMKPCEKRMMCIVPFRSRLMQDLNASGKQDPVLTRIIGVGDWNHECTSFPYSLQTPDNSAVTDESFQLLCCGSLQGTYRQESSDRNYGTLFSDTEQLYFISF
jgi:hypothetical protein